MIGPKGYTNFFCTVAEIKLIQRLRQLAKQEGQQFALIDLKNATLFPVGRAEKLVKKNEQLTREEELSIK